MLMCYLGTPCYTLLKLKYLGQYLIIVFKKKLVLMI